MEAIDKLLKKPLWFNVLVGIGAILVLLIVFFFSLGWITSNGQTAKVPSVVGLDVSAAQKNLSSLGFNVVLQDSIYVDTLARNGVLRQTPDADEVVKKGRTVYLTVNRVLAPLVDMPNLIGFSLQSAETYLKVLGLRVGAITMVPDRNKNVVLDQLVNALPIAPGTKIASGSVVNFMVGDGAVGGSIEVPDLIGLTVQMAKEKILGMGLVIGKLNTNGAIQDTASSFVVAQDPVAFLMQLDSLGMPMKNKVIPGGIINLTIDKVAPIRTQSDSIK